MSDFLFYLIAVFTAGCAVGVVANKNAVNAAMCLMLCLMGIASLFVLLDAYLLAALLVLVYAGAVVALFLFIVMLLDMQGGVKRPFRKMSAVASVAALGLMLVGVCMLRNRVSADAAPAAALASPVGTVLKNYAERGAIVHLDTQLKDATGGVIQLSTGETFESDVIVWTAGVMASPMLRNTDLPTEERGRLRVKADLRVVTADGEVVPDAWGAGDVSAVPDLTGKGVGGFCVPNAQHAVRQSKVLADNIVRSLRGKSLKPYVHGNLGAVAGLGLHKGVANPMGFKLKGWPAWFFHRSYHGAMVPTFNRKIRVIADWTLALFLKRETVSLASVEQPRADFELAALDDIKPKAKSSEPAA